MKITHWLGFDLLLTWILRYLLSLWVKPHLEPTDLTELKLNPKKPICYVLSTRSLADALVLEQACLNHKLNKPSQPLIVGLHREKHALVFLKRPEVNLLSEAKVMHKVPLLERITAHIQQHEDLDLQLIPVSIFWGRSPDKQLSFWKIVFSDTWSVPGTLRKWLMIAIHGRSTSVLFSPPISLRKLIDPELPTEKNLRKLLRILRVHFRRQREIVVGPDLSHRRTLVTQMLATPQVRAAIEKAPIANDTQPTLSLPLSPQKKLENKARHYANEIAADYSHAVVRAMELLLSWLWNKLYDGISVYNIDRLKAVTQDYEVVYLPCHRSHIDYLLLSFVVYRHGMVPPHIAAGINLNLPIIGPILRRSGAFFMRRSFKDNRLYTAVFNEYLHHILKNGFSLEYFIEGGRSRTGRSLQPKSGMLAMTARSYLRDTGRPIALMPIYIGYEKIFEGNTYVGELHGSKKKKESLIDLLVSLKKLKKNFGKVHLNFGTPIILDEVFQSFNPLWKTQSEPQQQQPWLQNAVDYLANTAMTSINKAAVINPINLLSLILLATPKHAMDESELESLLDIYVSLFKQLPYAEESETLALPGQTIIEYGERMGILQRHQHPLGDLLYLNSDTAIQLTYFRNNIVHLFAVPSLIACFIMSHARLSKERLVHLCQSVYPFLKAELFLHWSVEELPAIINQWVLALTDHDFVIETAAEGELTPPGPGTSGHLRLEVLASTVQQTLERYYVGLALLKKQGSGAITQTTLEEQCHLIAQRISFLYEFHAPEFFDKNLFKKFITELQAQQLIRLDDQQHLCFDEHLEMLYEYTRLTLSDEIRRSIRQETGTGAEEKAPNPSTVIH